MKGADIACSAAMEEKSMKFYFYRIVCFGLAAVFAWLTFAVAAPRVEARHTPVNAVYLLTVPSEYQAFENLVKSCKDSGANTLIIRPVSGGGSVDKRTIAKAVFFAHAAGMKLFVILPTRAVPVLLEEHPEWEDMQYDLRSGTIQPTGKIDLLNQKVADYFSDFFKDIAGYSVDAILLDEDFYYGDVEGMSGQALKLYKQKYASSFSAHDAFDKVKDDGQQNHLLDEYTDIFWNLAELKKERLLLFLKNIIQSAQTVNKEVRFGVPLPVNCIFLTQKEMLAWHSIDITALQKMDANIFWLSVRHRDIRAQQDLNYKKTIEVVSRIVMTSMSLVNDPAKVIIAIQTTSPSRKLLPMSEIEEVSSQAKKAGEPGIAVMIEPHSQLPAVLTKKIFKRQ